MKARRDESAGGGEARIRRVVRMLLRIGFGLILVLLVAGIFYRPLLYAGLVILIPALLGFAFSSPMTKRDYLAMLWWDQGKK